MKNYILVLLFIIINHSYAQVNRNGTLTNIVDSLIDAMLASADNNDYQTPSGANLTSWGNVIQDILAGNYSTANSEANAFGLTLYNLTDTSQTPEKTYYLLLKNTASTNYWGSFVYNPLPERQKMFIQCPHPLFDTNTGYQGIRIFQNLGARAYIVSGTYRCNNTTETTCAGTSTVCGGTSYRISDLAHNVDGTFQKSTEILEPGISGLIVIQPHGFNKDGNDPDLIMSNGNVNAPTTDYFSALKDNLLIEDNMLTFKIAHIDTAWTELIATTNTQGRLINGSDNPCNKSASSNAGRFFHIEQAYDNLRDSESNWNKLSNAIAATFVSDPLPVELVSFTASLYYNFIRLEWETATEVNNYGFEIERSETGDTRYENWKKIGFVNGHGNSNSPKYYNFVDNNPAFGNNFFRLMQLDSDGGFEYSDIFEINVESSSDILLEQNYPNPFNPITKIKFTIPEAASNNDVYLKIYDALGNEIATLINGVKKRGIQEIDFSGEKISSGVYYYTLTMDKFRETKKMILLK